MTTRNFKQFAAAIAAHFAEMSCFELFRVAIDGDDVWQHYLASFPEGTNPIYRVRTEHDGSYDRNVIRKLGNVVYIDQNGQLVSMWDAPDLAYPYDYVCKFMSETVKAAAIDGLFRINELKLGHVQTIEHLGGGPTKVWNHFHANIQGKHYCADVGAVCGEAATTVQVMRRGFEEINPAAVNTILDLIEQGNLYRGEEFRHALEQFRTYQLSYREETDEQGKSVSLWGSLRTQAARLRNTVIGTLLVDYTETDDLEGAVKRYEQKVAPTNYKRPTALITKGMIDQATKTIEELGLEPALERRFAVIGDISVNNVLWVDNQVQPMMKGGIAGLLHAEVRTPLDGYNAGEIHIDDFMEAVLPTAIGLEILFKGNLQSNLMSLTAPANTDVQPLFKWGNNFAWSYNGNITDSIKEKVKAAGGDTNAVLRVSLEWFNYDDLDLHAMCPDGHVYFGNKSGGYGRNILDVDMNAGGGVSRTPVENLAWTNPKDGTYKIVVDQYCRRETCDVGFTLEVENDGAIIQYTYPKAFIGRGETFLQFEVKDQKIVRGHVHANPSLTQQGISKQAWGISTETFVKVNTVLNSPNHWDGERTGNKHWFFILDQCRNDEPTRGIYNEFLKPELEKHRKVFEVLGNKTKCAPSQDQLSGLGFSSTKRDSVIVKVASQNSNRVYQINF
jgi:hypothetical protein